MRLRVAAKVVALWLLLPLAASELAMRFVVRFGERASNEIGIDARGMPGFPHEFWDSQQTLHDGKTCTLNRFGFRGANWQEQRQPGVGRVVMVGDSFGFGLGIGDDETLGAHLRALLPNTEVINLCLGCMNTHQERMVVERWLPRLRPDLTLLVAHNNDTAIEHCNPPPVPDCVQPRELSDQLQWWLLNHVYLFRPLNARFARDRCRGPRACPEMLDPGTRQRECFDASVARIVAVTREVRSPLLAVYYPPLHPDWQPGEEEDEWARDFVNHLARITRALGVPCLDLFDTFRPHGGAALKVDRPRDDHHPNGRANELAARAIVETWSRLGALDELDTN